MTLLDKKANLNDHIDRISELPSNVIDGILANLNIRDQVRTSILSTKWRYMWTSAPHLCFDNDFYQRFLDLDDPNSVISKIITDVLMLHNGPIHKFSIYVSRHYEFEISMENLNTWIPFMSKDIKHLELLTYCTPLYENEMPNILFSCKELTYFKFSSFKILSIPSNFGGFKKLRELHLECCDEIESSALETFISRCPILEKLSINHHFDCDYLVISSPSLKVLVLGLVNTKSICLKKANNLIDFRLNLYHHEVSGLIKSLPQIKRFTLVGLKKIPFADIIPPTLPTSSFSSLEYLRLDNIILEDKGDILYFVSLLKSAPMLIELNIQIYNDFNPPQTTDHSKELECCNYCPKLQTVNIRVGACSQQLILSLIQFILANSPSLNTLIFYCIFVKLDAPMLLKISQDLLRMERASPRAHVTIRHL